MSGVMVVRHHGRLLAVKRQGPDGPDRLRREAEVLAGLSHPGLVQLVDVSDREPVELRTAFVGPASWDRMPPPPRERVGALAAVAATIADLHALDTAHGSVRPSHVLTSDDERPVLCGLADAGAADGEGRADDLTGLADLVEQLADDVEPASVRPRLQELAARCRTGTIDARGLSRELDHLASARSPSRAGLLAGLDSRRGARVALVAAPLLVGVLALQQMSSSSPADGATASPANLPPTTMPTTTLPATTLPTTTLPTSTVPATDPPTTLPPAPAPEGPTHELVHDGRRFRVGEPGDQAVVGDWTCDGDPTAAVLRPDTGTIVVFDHWPEPAGTAEPAAVHEVPGAFELRIDDDREGCDALRVLTGDGSVLLPPATADPTTGVDDDTVEATP